MKSSSFVLAAMLYASTALAQTASKPSPSPVPTTQAPSSNSPAPSSTGGLKVRGPEAVAQQDPNKVVATIAGKPVTAQQALDMIKPLNPQERARFQDKLPELIQQIYMERQVADEAAKTGLDQQSPWKEQLQFARQNILTQAYLDKMAGGSSGAADPRQYYDTHPEDFDQAKVSGIVVSFSPPGTPAGAPNNPRTEAQAQEKVTELEKKIKAGTDFSALARTDSDEQRSSVKGGEMGSFAMGDAGIPPAIKAAVEKLKPGDVSEPVRVAGGFYILKLDSRSKVAFEQVQAAIKQKLQSDRSKIVLQQELAKYKVDVQDPDFFNASNAAAGPKIPSLARPSTTVSPQPPSKP